MENILQDISKAERRQDLRKHDSWKNKLLMKSIVDLDRKLAKETNEILFSSDDVNGLVQNPNFVDSHTRVYSKVISYQHIPENGRTNQGITVTPARMKSIEKCCEVKAAQKAVEYMMVMRATCEKRLRDVKSESRQ